MSFTPRQQSSSPSSSSSEATFSVPTPGMSEGMPRYMSSMEENVCVAPPDSTWSPVAPPVSQSTPPSPPPVSTPAPAPANQSTNPNQSEEPNRSVAPADRSDATGANQSSQAEEGGMSGGPGAAPVTPGGGGEAGGAGSGAAGGGQVEGERRGTGGATDAAGGESVGPAGGGGSGASAPRGFPPPFRAPPVPPARIGGVEAPSIDAIPALRPRQRDDIKRKSGLDPDEHHDRIRAQLNRMSSIARTSQIRIIQLVEQQAARLRFEVDRLCSQVLGAGEGAARLAGQRCDEVITGIETAANNALERVRVDGNANTSQADGTLTETLSNVEDSIRLGRADIAAAYTEVMGAYDGLASRKARELIQAPNTLDPAFVTTIAAQADAVRRNASGGTIGRYKNEIHGLNLPALAREAKANLDSGAAARAEGFSAAESRAAFSMQFLALTNPSAIREETIGRENQETMQCEVVGTRRRLKTRREQARDTILQKKNDALTQMRRTKTELQRSIREAAAKGAAGLRKQGRQIEHDLLSNRIPMAEAWRQRMLKLKHTFGPGRFFDLRRYWKGVEGGPLQLQKLRIEQEKAVRKQVSDALDGLTENRREQSRSLWDMARQATKEFPEVQLATSDDIREIQIHFTEAMRGECSNAEDEAVVHQRISQRRQRDQYPAQVKAAMYSALLKTPPQPPAGVTAGTAPEPANTIEGNFDTQIQNFKNEAIRLRDNFDREARAPGGAYEQLDTEVNRRMERSTRDLEGGINHTVMGFSATDEDRIYNAFNDLSSRGCKALTAYYDAHHRTSLETEFRSEFSGDELSAALHLAWGQRELAQEYLASSSKHWYGDNHDRARNSVRQLSDDELANLRAMPGWAGRRASIVEGLGSRDASIVGAYLDGDRNRAIGLQIDERITRARRDGEDAIIDGTADLDRMVAEDRAIALRDRVRPVSAEEEERGLEAMRQGTVRELAVASGALRREDLRDLTQEQVADRLASHLTRDRETQQGGGGRHGHHGGVRIPVSDQAKGAVQDMLRHGSNSPTARGARLAYEAHRGQTTGMSETRQERILAVGEDPELKSAREAMTRAENSHSPAAIEAARRRLERAQANHSTFLQSYARRSNGPPEARTNPAAAERHAISSLSPLFEGVHSGYGAEFVRTMIRDGRPSLLSVYMLATDKDGTHETMLDNAFANPSPEELRELRQRYATEVAKRPNDLQAFDRDYRSELSGDDRHRFEHALLTESGTDLNLIQHGLLGAGQNYEGVGGGGRYAMAGSDQERQLLATRNQLIDTVAAVSGLPRERVIGPDGRLTDEARRLAFTDPPEERLRVASDPVTHRPTPAGIAQWQAFRTSSIQLRGVSDRYKDGVDRAEERLLAVFQIIGAIATAALMIVFPASIILIGVLSAAIMGAATMVTKQVMRGGRYGWEEAVEDLASTGIDMAAALVGGRMAGKAISQGLRGANAVRAAVQRGLVTGAISGAGHAAIRDSTWKDGITTGVGRVLGEGVKQAAMNAATEGVSTWGGERLEGMFKRAPAGGARPDAEVHAPGGAHEGAPGPRPDAEVHGPGGAREGGPAARPDAEVHGPAGAHEGGAAPEVRGPAAAGGGPEGAPAGPRAATPELEAGDWNRFGRLMGPNGQAIVNEVLSNAGGVLAGDMAGAFADIVAGRPPHSLADFAESTGASQLRELIGAAARGRANANARNMRLKDRYHAMREELSAQSHPPTAEQRDALFKAARAAGEVPRGAREDFFRGFDSARSVRIQDTPVRLDHPEGAAHIPEHTSRQLARLPEEGLAAIRALQVEGGTPSPQKLQELLGMARTADPTVDEHSFTRAVKDAVRIGRRVELARGVMLEGVPHAQRAPLANVPIEIVPASRLHAMSGNPHAQAVTLWENGRPRIFLRQGADPIALRSQADGIRGRAGYHVDPAVATANRLLDRGNPQRAQLLSGDTEAVRQVLKDAGSWQNLMATLDAAGPAHRQLGDRLLSYRQGMVEQLGHLFQAHPVSSASAERISDVDLSTRGKTAGADLIAAEAWMTKTHGPNWMFDLRMNFYTEASRLTAYAGVVEGMDAPARAALQQRVSQAAENFNVARQIGYAHGDPAELSRIRARFPEADLAAAQRLAAMSPDEHLARRNELLGQLDDLATRMEAATEPSQRQQLATEMTLKQAEANLHTVEAYIAPGAGRMTVDAVPVRGFAAYDAAVSNLSELAHILHAAGGDPLVAMRQYEAYKYILRFTQAAAGAGQAGDPHLAFLEGIARHLYRIDREAFRAEPRPGRPPPPSDADIRQIWETFQNFVDRSLPSMRAHAHDNASDWAARPSTPPPGPAPSLGRRVGAFFEGMIDRFRPPPPRPPPPLPDLRPPPLHPPSVDEPTSTRSGRVVRDSIEEITGVRKPGSVAAEHDALVGQLRQQVGEAARAAIEERIGIRRSPEAEADYQQLRQYMEDLSGFASGQDAVVARVMEAPNPQARQELLRLFRDYQALMRVDPRDMTHAQRDLVLRAQAEFYAGFASADTLRKVVPVADMQAIIEGRYSAHVGGSVGDARHTQGLTAAEIVQKLGLDYTNERGQRPYLHGDEHSGFRPVNEVVFIDIPITAEIRQKVQVPMDEHLIAHAAASTDPQVRALYDQGRLLGGEWQNIRRDAAGNRDLSNPYAGHGGTITGSLLPTAPAHANQELQIPTNRRAGNLGAEIPAGSAFRYRGADGQDYTIAHYRQPPEGGPPRWVIADDLPAGLRARLVGSVAGTTNTTASGGFWGRVKAWMGLGRPEPVAPPPVHPPTTADVHGLFGSSSIDQIRPGSGPTARYVKDGWHMVVEAPPGRSPAQVRQDVASQLAAEHLAIHQAASSELGVNLAIVRGGGAVSYQRRPDGSVQVRVPYGMDLSQVGPQLQRQMAEAAIHLKGTTDHSVIQNGQNVVVGHPIADVAQGHRLLSRLAQGDLSALAEVGVHGMPDAFHSDSGQRSAGQIEWGLGRLPNGEVILIRGEAGQVDWGRYPDVVALAHSHPSHDESMSAKVLDLSGGGTVDQVLNHFDNSINLLPSSADLRFVHARGIEGHVVHSPYRYNPATGQLEAGFDRRLPPVDVHIVSTTEGSGGSLSAHVEIRSGPVLLWSGTVDALNGFSLRQGFFDRTPAASAGDLHFVGHNTDASQAATNAITKAAGQAPDAFIAAAQAAYPATAGTMSAAALREFHANLVAYKAATANPGLTLENLLTQFAAGRRFNPTTQSWVYRSGPELLAGSARFHDELMELCPEPGLQQRLAKLSPAELAEFRAEIQQYVRLNPSGNLDVPRLAAEYLDGRRVGPAGLHHDPSGGESFAAMRARLINDFPPPQTFGQVQAAAAAKYGANLKAVVPIEGVYRMQQGGEDLTFGHLLDPTKERTLHTMLVQAYRELGNSGGDARKLADAMVAHIKAGQLVVVQGTPMVRSTMDYDARYRKATPSMGGLSKPEVHHMHPLYLGGSHQLQNLIALEGISQKLHDQMHAFFDKLGGAQNMNANALYSAHATQLRPGYAVVEADGTVHIHLHDEPP